MHTFGCIVEELNARYVGCYAHGLYTHDEDAIYVIEKFHPLGIFQFEKNLIPT